MREAVILKALDLEEHKDLMKTLVTAKAAVISATRSQEEVDSYQELVEKLINLYYPELESQKEKLSKDQSVLFDTLFKTREGKPKTIQMEVEDEISEELKVKDYFKKK